MKKVLQWIAAGFCASGVLVYQFNICSLFLLLACVLFLPIPAIRNFFEEKLKMKKTLIYILAIILIFVGIFTAPTATMDSPATQETTPTVATTSSPDATIAPTSTSTTTSTATSTTTSTTTVGVVSTITPDTAPTMNAGVGNSDSDHKTVISLSDIPAYSGDAFIAINDNVPLFTAEELTTTSYESYSALDSFGRCGVAIACCGKDIMPTGERGDISSVKPSGWVQAKYDFVNGTYLYNRCHLIGWQLSAENANKKNLITGTRYFNTEGMLPFENMVADYIKETGNHVMYRVTPLYEGNNLVANGVQLEAYSVEDNGEGICFHVYCYNVQPGVKINYATGESISEVTLETSTPTPIPTRVPTLKPTVTPAPTKPPVVTENSGSNVTVSATYILNVNTKKIHHPGCRSVKLMKEENKKEYTGSIDDLLSMGYTTCGNCF